MWELPFGRGKKFGTCANRVAGEIISGWQLHGIYTLQSGRPNQLCQTAVSYPWVRAGTDKGVMHFGDIHDIRLPHSQQTADHWFNTARLVRTSSQLVDTNYQLRTILLRFGFIRPDPLNNLDLSVPKNTRIAESKDFQFRLEPMNATNHPTFAAPVTNRRLQLRPGHLGAELLAAAPVHFQVGVLAAPPVRGRLWPGLPRLFLEARDRA